MQQAKEDIIFFQNTNLIMFNISIDPNVNRIYGH
jgi:hypothetical protein